MNKSYHFLCEDRLGRITHFHDSNTRAELHEDTGEPLRASTPLLTRGVGRRRPGADGSFAADDSAYRLDQLDLLLRWTLRTD